MERLCKLHKVTQLEFRSSALWLQSRGWPSAAGQVSAFSISSTSYKEVWTYLMKGGGRKEALQLNKPPKGLLSLPSEPLGLGGKGEGPPPSLGLAPKFLVSQGWGPEWSHLVSETLPPTHLRWPQSTQWAVFILPFLSFFLFDQLGSENQL